MWFLMLVEEPGTSNIRKWLRVDLADMVKRISLEGRQYKVREIRGRNLRVVELPQSCYPPGKPHGNITEEVRG